MSDSGETPRRSLTAAAAPALIAAAVSALGAFALVGFGQGAGQPEAPVPGCILEGAEVVGGPISLVDHNGAPVTQADFAGDPMVLYFGYTHCPDVCPTSLNTLAGALAEPGGFDPQTAFVTLDPERDTPQVVAQYVRSASFPPGIRGVDRNRSPGRGGQDRLPGLRRPRARWGGRRLPARPQLDDLCA